MREMSPASRTGDDKALYAALVNFIDIVRNILQCSISTADID